MYRKDKIRIGVALGLLAVIFFVYFFTNNKDITGYTALISTLVWLGVMYFLRKND